MTKMTQMTKSQLKSGMILERRDGQQFLLFRDIYREGSFDAVINGTNRAVSINVDQGHKFIRLCDYSDNLCFLLQNREYDIVKVWNPTHLEDLFANKRPIEAKILWERPKEKYTYEQLKAIIGHDFDFVG